MESRLNLKQKIVKSYKTNIFYLVFRDPDVYFLKLFNRTLSIGFFTLILSYVYIHTGLHEVKIPSTMHGLIGVVIGLLLVFRTNTAYDRWWEGRKSLSSLSTAISFFSIKFNSSVYGTNRDNAIFTESAKAINTDLINFLIDLKQYLQNSAMSEHIIHVSDSFHLGQMKYMEKILFRLHELERNNIISVRDVAMLEGSVNHLLEHSNVCERIKNTPIPIAYSLHIKMSILIYLITLPFGLFYDLGLWATPVVMLIFYLIAGIEIISSEIENPFAGDPNDLPTEEIVNSIIGSIHQEHN